MATNLSNLDLHTFPIPNLSGVAALADDVPESEILGTRDIRYRGYYRYGKDEFSTLRGRLGKLKLQEEALANATSNQTRDRLMACAIVAAAVGLIAAMVFGSPAILATGGVLLGVLVLSCLFVAYKMDEKDGLPKSYIFSSMDGGSFAQPIIALLAGIPLALCSLFCRKSRLEENIPILKGQITDEFTTAGKFLKAHREALLVEATRQRDLRKTFLENAKGKTDVHLEESGQLVTELEGPAKELVEQLNAAGLIVEQDRDDELP